MNVKDILEEQQLPELFITVEPRSQLQERQLQPLLKSVSRAQIPTVEHTLSIYGLKAYYCLPSGVTTTLYDASSFDVFVSRFVNIATLKAHLKERGFYRDTRTIRFMDGTYYEEEDEDESAVG